MFPEDFSRALENAGGLSPSFTDRYVVEELIHASCTRGNFVPASGVSFRAVRKKKRNLIPLTGHEETEQADGFRFTWKGVSLHSVKKN